MKVDSFRMANGKIELRVADNSGAICTMRFENSRQLSALSSAIAVEAEKQKQAAYQSAIDDPRQLTLFPGNE